jgi:CBS domain-containing protein
LAEHVVDLPIPLGFFKHFIVEKSGKYKNRINLKMSGLVPLTTCIKLLAFHQGITATNTLERLEALVEEKVISSDQGEFLVQAFETFLTLKIRNNLNDIEQGREFGNHIDPAELSTRQKQVLKEAFLAISQLQKTTRQVLKVEGQDLGSVR